MTWTSARTVVGAGAVALILLGVGFFWSVAAQAQGSLLAMSPEQRNQLETRLNLSESQKPQVREIIQRSNSEREAIFRKHGVTGGSGKKPGLFQLVGLNTEMKGVDQWTQSALSKILSPVQMREYTKIHAERREAIKRKLLN
jgi:hypothetical protein